MSWTDDQGSQASDFLQFDFSPHRGSLLTKLSFSDFLPFSKFDKKSLIFEKMSNYREMLEDYRDVDIDELMAGLTEEELKKFFK